MNAKNIEFHPGILRPAPEVDASVEIHCGPSAMPFGIAPTGFARLIQAEGEVAGASAAGAAGIPFTLSTLGTTSIEGVKTANPKGRNWLQLYPHVTRPKVVGAREGAVQSSSPRGLVRQNAYMLGALGDRVGAEFHRRRGRESARTLA